MDVNALQVNLQRRMNSAIRCTTFGLLPKVLHLLYSSLPNNVYNSVYFQYNLAVDMSRRQLEYEMQCLHDLMQKELGSAEQIAQRHDARLHRIRAIENEMLRMQQQYRQQVQVGGCLYTFLI